MSISGQTGFSGATSRTRTRNRLLQMIPPELRVHGTLNHVVEQFHRPSYKGMVLAGPSEAIRSADIIEMLGVYFETVERRDYGGMIFQQLFADIIHNFSPQTEPAHAALLDALFAEERDLIQRGVLPSHYTVVVLR